MPNLKEFNFGPLAQALVFDLVRFGLVWFGLVWFGLSGFGLLWFGIVWYRSHKVILRI